MNNLKIFYKLNRISICNVNTYLYNSIKYFIYKSQIKNIFDKN